VSFKKVIFFILILPFASFAQQTTNYIQYVFGKGAINPAASGVNINQKYYYTFGGNRQWFQLDNAPKATFANFSFTKRPPRSYSYWQNFGVLVERDQSGLMSNNSFYLSYTIHLLLRKNFATSFGVYAGFRKFYLSPGVIDPADPVLQNSSYYAYSYPDLIPGFRLANKKFFLDIVARQVIIPAQKDVFSGRQVAGGSRLNPTLFIAYGRVFSVSENWIMLPSVSINGAILSIPAISSTLMFYYSNRFGLGLASRNLSFLSAIVQFRVLQNLSVGLAYSYSINRINTAAPHNYEIMVGVAPMGLAEKHQGRRSVAKCPGLDF
jgi:type IX secretion system PorP/SprF family membrane protein